MSKVSILQNAPADWTQAGLEAAAAPIVAQVVTLKPTSVYLHWSPGSLATALGIAKALPSATVVLVAPYAACEVAKRGVTPWDAYWTGPAAAINKELVALPNVKVWTPGQGEPTPAERDQLKVRAYRALGRSCNVLIAPEQVSSGVMAQAIDAASTRGITKTAPWTEVPAPATPTPAPAKKRATRAKKRVVPATEALPF